MENPQLRTEETFTCLLCAQQQLHQDDSSLCGDPQKQNTSIPSLCCDIFADRSILFPSQLLPTEGLFPSPFHCLGAVLLLLMNVKCFGPAALMGGG